MSLNVADPNALRQAVNLSLFSTMKDLQKSQAQTMLNDFTNAQAQITQAAVHPTSGRHIDLRL